MRWGRKEAAQITLVHRHWAHVGCCVTMWQKRTNMKSLSVPLVISFNNNQNGGMHAKFIQFISTVRTFPSDPPFSISIENFSLTNIFNTKFASSDLSWTANAQRLRNRANHAFSNWHSTLSQYIASVYVVRVQTNRHSIEVRRLCYMLRAACHEFTLSDGEHRAYTKISISVDKFQFALLPRTPPLNARQYLVFHLCIFQVCVFKAFQMFAEF